MAWKRIDLETDGAEHETARTRTPARYISVRGMRVVPDEEAMELATL